MSEEFEVTIKKTCISEQPTEPKKRSTSIIKRFGLVVAITGLLLSSLELVAEYRTGRFDDIISSTKNKLCDYGVYDSSFKTELEDRY